MKVLPLLAVWFAVVSALCGQETSVPMPPLAEAKAEQVAGLNLTFSSGGKTDARAVRLAALHVPAGQPPSPFLPAGAFTARFEGSLQSPLRAEVTLAADLSGAVKVTVNGAAVLEGTREKGERLEGAKLRLNKGANPLVIEFTSPAQGDATFRLLWAASDFFIEPVPPTVFQRDAAVDPVRAAERVREGRLLFAQNRCAACHDAADLLPAAGQGMPELAHDAPVFAEFGSLSRELACPLDQ